MKYKHIIISQYGGPEVLQVVEDELPEPQPNEVRVKVLAAGVAWGDILKRRGLGSGTRPPFTPGYDIVGVVDKFGTGISSINVGQIVAALPVVGGYSEFLCLSASELVQVPAGVDPAEAVCLVMNYVVAHQLLHRTAGVKTGERILVHSAAGGVGTALLQLGNLSKLEMYGTASRNKHETLTNLGATSIDYQTEDFVKRVQSLTGDGVDVVFDPIGGTHIWQSYQALRKGGRLIVYGVHTIVEEGMLSLALGLILSWFLNLLPDHKSIMNYSVTRPKYSLPKWCRSDLIDLLELLEHGKIKPIVAEKIPLVDVVYAHELLEKGMVNGKLVLVTDVTH